MFSFSNCHFDNRKTVKISCEGVVKSMILNKGGKDRIITLAPAIGQMLQYFIKDMEPDEEVTQSAECIFVPCNSAIHSATMGKMAIFLTTRGTASEIERIINNATSGVVLISPFIKIPDSLFQNLRAADHRGVKITIVYGKKMLELNSTEQLNQLKNVKLYYLDNLHAKCYFNEQSMVITSLNLYDFSEQNNREMGILITLQNDKGAFAEAVREANMIVSLAERSDNNVQVKEQPKKQVKQQPSVEKRKLKNILFRDLSEIFPSLFSGTHGYCIGCKTKIEYDEYKPYCPECYKAWLKKKSQNAKYCLSCGRPSTTSINKPLCRSCFEKSSK